MITLSIFILTPGVAVGEVVFVPGGDTPLAGSCVVDVLGTDSGTAKFIAVWLPSVYKCKMGYYLGPSATDCTKCIENHYCPGGDFGYDEFVAQMAKAHNNANIIVFGGRTMNIEDVIKYCTIFINTKFESGRHQNRLNKLDD